MNPEKLANGIKELFIDDAIESYKERYKLKALSETPTQYEKDIHKVLSSLDQEGVTSFYNLISTICEDNAVSLCAFLDGSCGYIGQDSHLKLVAENNPEESLNGSLMTYLDNCLCSS